jgi:hypothetical protein
MYLIPLTRTVLRGDQPQFPRPHCRACPGQCRYRSSPRPFKLPIRVRFHFPGETGRNALHRRYCETRSPTPCRCFQNIGPRVQPRAVRGTGDRNAISRSQMPLGTTPLSIASIQSCKVKSSRFGFLPSKGPARAATGKETSGSIEIRKVTKNA